MPKDEPEVTPAPPPNPVLEEFKELGNEYRYRDQLMVQEFSLSMIGLGVVANVLMNQKPSAIVVVGIAVTTYFLYILRRHLTNINQDRRAALERRETLREKLGFEKSHLGVRQQRKSVPLMMIDFVRLLMWVWFISGVVVLARAALPNRTAQLFDLASSLVEAPLQELDGRPAAAPAN